MLTTVLAATAEEAEHRELPIAPEWFGLTALVVLFGLLAFTWAFRSVATKH